MSDPVSMKRLDVGDTSLFYSVSGSGPAVLMIQGVGVAGSGWGPQQVALARRFTVISFDNRGLGRTPLGTAPLTIERMAADALAIVDAERIERFHIAGHSMGGLIALHVALAAAVRVKSLTLLCTFGDGKDGSRLSASMLLLGLQTRIGTRRMRRTAMLRLIMPDDYLRTVDADRLAETLNSLFGRDLADQPPIVAAQLRAMSRCNVTSRLRELAGVPSLVMSGRHDRIAPPHLGRALASGLGARFVEFDDAGHALPIQRASEVNAMLGEHLLAAEGAHIL